MHAATRRSRFGPPLLRSRVAAALAEPATAMAGAVPDASVLASLRASTANANLVRVTTSRAEWLAHGARFDSSAVYLPLLDDRAALVTPSAPRPEDAERKIAWPDVERIDAGRSRLGLGLGAGLATGAVLGGLLVASHWRDVQAGGDGGLAIVFAGMLVLGGGAGGLLLGAANPSMRTVYP